MARPKRWFPVSHELPFADRDVWTFTDEFGDRALRTWLWILSQLDQTDNAIPMPEEDLVVLSRQLRQTSASLRRQVGWMLAKGWLTAGEQSSNGWPTIVSAPKFAEYHRARFLNVTRRAHHPSRLLSEPILSEPIRTEEKKKIARRDGKPSRASAFPDDWNVEGWMEDLCHGFALNPHAEFADFRNHHLAKGTVFKSWPHAFRTWVARSVKLKQTRRPA